MNPCSAVIKREFNKTRQGHFSCDDLIANDDQALFFFIQADQIADKFTCISVCSSNGGPSVGNYIGIVIMVILQLVFITL